MSKNPRGGALISKSAIAAIVSNAATECYGVVGLASKRLIMDNIAELLRKENYSQGVYAKNTRKGILVDMYIIVSYGVRLTEVVSEVQKKVRYVLTKTLNARINKINVYVHSVKNT
jgi:uncharacterized alkaline shock family protein YloU